jgi:hypothetical protein
MVTTPQYAKFKGVTNYGETQILTEIENNLKQFLDWAFLKIGAWSDVTVGLATPDGYGGAPETLRYVADPSYTDGQVWQGFRQDWIYESGVDFNDGTADRNPLNIEASGVQVDGTYQTTGYHIDYPLGRVIFDTAISTTSAVKLNYSYRNVQSVVADNAPWWRELQLQSFRSDDPHFTQSDRTGDWSIGNYSRIQLPTVIVEAIPRGISRPYELGNGSLWIEQDVLFHILADDRVTRNKLVGILQVQNDKGVWLFDSDVVAASSVFPLDYRGERVNGNVYPDIVSDTTYQYKKCRFRQSTVTEVGVWNPKLYEGTVRTTCELVFGSS